MNRISETKLSNTLPASVKALAEKRKGGRVNITGIEYQLQYAIYKALTILSSDSGERLIRLEGIEDVDVLSKIYIDNQELFQLKHTSDALTPSKIWQLKVLQNFAEAHLLNKKATFVIVTNQPTKDARLAFLSGADIDEQSYIYWQTKFDEFQVEDRVINWNWNEFDLRSFLKAVTIQVIDRATLRAKTESLIIQYFELTNSTYPIYLSSLFHHFFLVSLAGGTVDRRELLRLKQYVQDQQALGVVNPAVQQRLITPVDFTIKTIKDYTSYFDGQPAQPVHIAAGLPAPRPKLERQIIEHLGSFDVAVIKASSGQGKSTLAWRVSQSLYQQGRQVYQLHSCSNAESVGGLVEFIETRVRMTEAPIIVIDGLSTKYAEWAEFISRLTELPVKFIVTTREEDWVRFGREAYRVQTGESIGMNFNQVEAKQIYEELKRHKRIHPNCGHWQAAWERVYQRGLLMEYVYLLTRGEMLRQRLSSQLTSLNAERDGGIKHTVLRLITTAHDIGISLQTARLRQYIKTRFEFILQGDLGELLHQLEAEYYVRFDRYYVEGLHPVRSNHLVALLHRTDPVSETLLELATLIELANILTFGKVIPQRVDEEEQSTFYEKLVGSLQSYTSDNWSTLLLGIYQGEVERHREKHRTLCDSVFKNGGYELFAMSTIPYPHEDADPVSLIQQITSDPENHVIKALRELPALPIQETSLRLLLPVIYKQLIYQRVPLIQMGQLLTWFSLFQLKIDMPSDEETLSWLINCDTKTAYYCALGLSAVQTNCFNDFVNRHQEEIVYWLKRKIGALKIESDNNRIQIEYLLTDENIGRANDKSVELIDIVRAWLPVFQTYETNAIVFPYPNEEITSVVRQDAHKTLSPKAIFNPLTVSLNRSWDDSLLEPYRSDSIYSWQLAIITLREQAVNCAQRCYQLIDLLLQRKSASRPFEKALREWDQYSDDFLATYRKIPFFPFTINPLTQDEGELQQQRKEVRDWILHVSNYYRQFAGLLKINEPETRRLALLNLRQLNVCLPKMQQSFVTITEQTISYFDTADLEKQETYWYGRLRRASIYYGEHVFDSTFETVSDVAVTIASHWKSQQSTRYQTLIACLDNFAELSGYTIYKPDRLVDEELTTHATVGIEGLTAKEVEEDFEQFVTGLASIALTDVDFLTVIICKGRKAIGGFRFNRNLFDKVMKIFDGEDVDILPSDAPIPINLNADAIKTLPDVTWSEPALHPIGKPISNLYQTLWMLIETVKRYQVISEVDKNWKDEQINTYNEQANNCLRQIIESPFINVANRVKILCTNVLALPSEWSGNLLAEHLIGTANLLLKEHYQ